MDGWYEWFKIWLISKRSWEWRGGNLSSLHLDHINSHRPVAENPRKVGCREGVDTGKKPMKTTRMVSFGFYNETYLYNCHLCYKKKTETPGALLEISGYIL